MTTSEFNNATLSLISCDIKRVSDASAAFGQDNSLLVARPYRNYAVCLCLPKFWFTVPEGFFALVTRHGADVDYVNPLTGVSSPVWPAGLHIGPPWLRVSHLVTKQSIVLKTPVYACKTSDNVSVDLHVTLVMRVMGDASIEGDDPMNVRTFVHRVTADGLRKQLQDAQAEAVRTLARSVTHTEVFGLRSVSQKEMADLNEKLALSSVPPTTLPVTDDSIRTTPEFGVGETKDDSERDMIGTHEVDDVLEAGLNTEQGANVTTIMKDRLNSQFKPQGVEIMDVIIENIRLPSEIQEQMSQKTMVISQNAEQRMQQKHDMLVLAHDESIKTLQQTHQEAKMELEEEGAQALQIQKQELAYEQAQGFAALQHILCTMSIDVESINSKSSLEVQRVNDRATLEAERLELEAKAESTATLTEARAHVAHVVALADLECALKEKEGHKHLNKAEAQSALPMRTYRDHTTSQKRIEVHRNLATNKNLVVTGTSGGQSANRLILADAALRSAAIADNHHTVDNDQRSQALSELAVARGTAQMRIYVGASGDANNPSTMKGRH